jgi:hypothetical protein
VRGLLPVVCCAACTSLGSAPMFEAAPSTPLAITVSTDPPTATSDDGAARDADIRLTFDDYPDPDTAVFGPVLLRSGTVNFDADVRVDLVGRAIVIHPRALLAANSVYEVALAPTVRALDGRSVGGRGFFTKIAVGSGRRDPARPQERLIWDGDDGVGQQLNGCSSTCHSRVGASGEDRDPTRRLDFTRMPDDPIYGVINVPSVGLAGTPWQLARVTPYDSARSVLLRKLLGGNHRNSRYPPYPEMRIDGQRMPISPCDETPDDETCKDAGPAPPWNDVAIRTIQAWIDQGAAIQ